MSEELQHPDQPDPLDRLLARLAAAGTAGIEPAGAGAARRRARRRTVHQRLAASALALAVLAGVGGVAAARIHPADAGIFPAIGASTRAAASPSPTPTTDRSDPAVGQHTVAPDPSQYVAAAWLGTNGLPFAAQADWMQLDRPDPRFHDLIFTPLPDDDDEISPCGSSGFLSGSVGAQEQQYGSQHSVDNMGSGHDVINADQSIYIYPDDASVDTAWSRLTASFQCQTGTHILIGVVGWITAGDSSGQSVCSSEEVAWDKAGDAAIMHDCYVRYGTLIAMTSIKVMTSDPAGKYNFAASDEVTVQRLDNALRVYTED